MTSNERLDLLEFYAEQALALLPLEPKSKRPRSDVARGWSSYTVEREEIPTVFAAGCNVGVLLGAASRGIVDVDLDCSEALGWASAVLPPTLTFGRAGSPRSHWIYRVAVAPARVMRVLDLPTVAKPRGKVLCELRSAGGQTMFPPSTHPSGEVVEWTPDPDAELCSLSAAELVERVNLLGAVCLTERHAGRAAAERLSRGEWPTELRGLAALRVRELVGVEDVQQSVPRAGRTPTGSWIERLKARGPAEVARAFGLAELRPATFACPACGADRRGSRESRGSIGLFADGAAWRCYRCDAKGDAVGLAAWAAQGTPLAWWPGLRAACAERGLLS